MQHFTEKETSCAVPLRSSQSLAKHSLTMITWRTACRTLTKEVGLPRLRFHDLRHHAITKLAESGASDQTIMALAGHVSQEMLAHYSHVRQQAKRDAVEAINSYQPDGSTTTENATIQ